MQSSDFILFKEAMQRHHDLWWTTQYIAFKHGLEIVVNIVIGFSVFVLLPDELPYKDKLRLLKIYS